MKTICIITALLMLLQAQAQTKFIGQCKIEYEKTVNMKKVIEEDPDIPDAFKNNTQGIVKSYFDLLCTNNQTLYKKGREANNAGANTFFWGTSSDPLTYMNFTTGQVAAQKPVMWQEEYIADTAFKIQWRVTFDTRTIAGYECRKAVGRLFDSLYVVAFYTDEILVPGGPESFSGLPGMILGLAIPRLHTTWFATTVSLNGFKEEDVKAPEAGKKTKKYTYAQMQEKIVDRAKDWGMKQYDKRIWQLLF